MASTYPAVNLPYNQQSHAQQYWNSQYPPPNNYPKPSSALDATGPPLSTNVHLDPRAGLNRTPSPTPSEMKELQSGAIDFKAMMNWRFWIRREWLWYYVAVVIISIITVLITIFHDQIVGWLTPFTQWLHDLKFGWLVPIGILFVISFPPLFGHEIVAILCGLVWGLWPGFGIVAAGTFIGEIGNFYAFKYCCRARGEKMEKTKISYACLAKVVRDGGFKIALIARLSAIPGHFTTAVFSTCGMNVFVFAVAAVLSLPKQFITVYLGVILGEAAGQESTKQKLISDGVVAVTVIVTVAACWYLLRKMNEVKPDIIYARRKARQIKLNNGSMYSTPNLSGSDVYNPNASESNIPLTAKKSQFGHGGGQNQPYPFSSEFQRSSIGNIIYAPKAQHRYSPENLYGNEDPELGHVAPGAATSSPYNYTPTRQTSDEVGFDAAGQAGVDFAASSHHPSPRIPPGVSKLPRTQSPEAIPHSTQPPISHNQSQSPSLYPQYSQQHQPSSYSSYPYQTSASPYITSTPPPAHVQQPYTTSNSDQPEVVQTPTQAQFASYNPNALSSERLPTPGYHSSSIPIGPVGVTSGMQSPIVGTPTQYAPQAYMSQHAHEPTDATYHTAMASSDSVGFSPSGPVRSQEPPPPSYF
ncbi:hypothetical protein GGU11DRAFT_748191 [Lentinula aff. detonsa]|uniref:Golgi apparatus membrane protein TVP38 n=1 Tax=Lentinula aff. detonsa TaxID=2804958 RepID=A0AA38K8N6_9AGAR|nr:hypothetical protein GGU10DRAFT_81673 [Lentinula aff. detonsa]KAJ3794211.1 hypothetical protein GGU11DRAFT_748191 [Lentinula aff. detonsa]